VDAEEKLGITPFSYSGEIECTYCELENKCRFFQELDDVPDNKEMIKMWLEEEAE
jgi:ATP-dependent helicase/DNAse subunit B